MSVLLAGAVFVGVQEHRRPWYFYDMVGSKLPPFDLFGGRERRVQIQQQLAPVAQDIASWDGVERVEWPKVQVVDGNGAPFEQAEARLYVHLSSKADLNAFKVNARTVVEDALQDDIALRLVIWRGDQVVWCRILDEFDEDKVRMIGRYSCKQVRPAE